MEEPVMKMPLLRRESRLAYMVLCEAEYRGSVESLVPRSSYNGEADAEAYPKIGPCIWRDCF
jgi:hypothetical protein